jgi:hypothetical protein
LRPSETAVCKGLVEGDGGRKEGGDRRGEGRRKQEGGSSLEAIRYSCLR